MAMEYFYKCTYYGLRVKMSHKKVLVFLQNKKDATVSPVHFTQSIVGTLVEKDVTNVCEVFVCLEDGQLKLSQTPFTEHDEPLKLKRPSFCPIHNMVKDQIQQLPKDIYERGVDCGAVTILESCDGKVLLTRRADHLRTFPGIWVPPGGHIEINETFLEAALRELYEETGLQISKDWCENQSLSKLALWESVFPPKLNAGLPKRHHIVTYLHAKLKSPYTSAKLDAGLKLDPEEVGASAWIDRKTIEAIVSTIPYEESGIMSEANMHEISSALCDTIQATVISRTETAVVKDLSTLLLLKVATGENADCERVSTGTKFALSQWLLRKV